MSTENEGTAVPAAPSAPPSPVPATDQSTPELGAPADRAPAPEPTAELPVTAQPPVQQPAQPPVQQPAQPAAQQPPAPHAPQHQAPQHQAPQHPAPQSAAAPHTPAPQPPVHEVPAAQPYPQPQPHQQAAPGAAWPPPPPAYPAYGNAYGTGGGGDAHHGGGGGSDPWGAPLGSDAPQPRRKGRGGMIAAVLVAALVAGGVGSGIGFWAANREANSPGGSTTISAAGNPQDFKRDPGTVAGVAGKALPSVVTIDAQSGSGEGGTGTGFVYDKQGHILTNNHVVASAANGGDLSVTFSNGKKYAAEVVGRAQGYDVAVLKLKNAGDLNPLPLGDSDKVVVGDATIAIGAPFGLSNTVTTGIISAKDRPVASGDGQGSKASYMSALQTDASINPGNSGGPLLDSRGAVIGINSAIQSVPSGGFGSGGGQAGSIGLGFAIPINQAKTVAEQLIKTGKPVYPMIGATVSMDQKGDGAKIAEAGTGNTPAVTPNGPAAAAGLKPGDVITKFEDRVIDSGPTLISEIWTHKPGDKVKLTYTRGGKESTAEVTLQAREGDG
ncbi:trypsin-like peptidase domain-containing protein [Streptomyces sp. NBC_00237]|uniref:S1C family serine protease n=1 Tax=Streptomyces sp. NBC_00237 TaxID=2975687 RepID=UPI00225567EE|nr:trypsin-like peptidase domain-containing protein [Streptomyces sp. NBC_00237]MCX5199970.1 trypsin-like peptidase domain-containing protein [Streptomyces sp. NBC_00237]